LGGASEVVHVYLSTGSSFSIPTPFGDWQLDFPWYSFLPLALDGSGEHVSSLAWPSDPTLVGIDVYFQAFTLPTLALTEVERVRFLP
jgi:hypothetical protein